ncbi:MAG: hypothetical protein FWF22_05245, partial [Treponema sp.]|nr:hypothetical protein [Treponema sp.]
VAATHPSVQWNKSGISGELVLKQALGMLRYSLYTHLSGDKLCVDGHSWGHSWIYILGIDRAMHAIETIWNELSAKDRDALRQVLISEADWLLFEYPVEAGLTENNKPESNIWNGNILIRAGMMYPDAVNANKYIEKACKFFANGISVPGDETNPATRELFVGPNYTEKFGLNHHHYLNIGYMNICLSNIAMLHFSAKHNNWKLPDIVYHHALDLWRLVRTFTFDDGRLLRIGGDSRARYCYCQDFALPAWALAEDLWDEDCSSLLSGWLEILKKETDANMDGSFLSERFSSLEYQSPLYYTRLESDRANVISMLVSWYKRFSFNPQKKSEIMPAWDDKFFGAVFSTSGNRYASFAWNSCEKPQGLCVPKNNSSLAEWRHNLAGSVRGTGDVNYDGIIGHREQTFPGGFITSGSTICYSDNFVAEGQTREDVANKIVAFAALPDEKTVLGIQYAVSPNRIYGSMIKGIFWHIPNDIFNNCRRRIKCEKGQFMLRGGHWADRKETLQAGHWINADGETGLVSSLPLVIVRNGKRQIGITSQPDTNGTLYTEEICAPYEERNRWYERGEILIDVSFASHIGNDEETKVLSESFNADLCTSPSLRSVSVMASDGRIYVLVLNISDSPAELSVKKSGNGELNILSRTAAGSIPNVLSPGDAILAYYK